MTQSDDLKTRPRFAGVARWLALGTIIGCGHTEPFGSRQFGTDQPFDPAPPVRLTFNQGVDRDAAWLTDGSGVLYSATESGTQDHDICLGLLPPTGGQLRRLSCDLSPNSGHLTDAFQSAAPAPNGSLAYVAVISRIGAVTPDEQGIVLASIEDPINRRVLRAVP
ncbi:MAG TPA: hypothetical protein VGJ36_00380, partial [Gemmatimonadales bacterium]